MSKIRFLHCADLHLDLSFAGSLASEPAKALKRREELKECFEDICSLAKQQKVDFMIIAGDLYEHSYIRKSTVDFLIEKFRELFPMRIFICAGNHDPFIIGSVYEELINLPNVHIFGLPQKVELSEFNVDVYGEGFVDFYKDEASFAEFSNVNETKINILISHGTLNCDIGKNRYNPLSEDGLKSLGMDYIAIGHFHGRMLGLEKEGIIFNPGSPEALGFDELGEHGVYICEIEKIEKTSSKKVTFVPTGKRCYKEICIDISGIKTMEELIVKISEKASNSASEEDFIKIILKGFLNESLKVDVEKISKSLKSYFFAKIEDLTLRNVDFNKIEDGTLKGEFIKKMLKLINDEEDEHKRKNLTFALNIGMEVIETGAFDIEKYLS